MNTRKGRMAEILDILNHYSVSSQDELVKHLSCRGYKITQATLSRDLKALKANKVSDNRGHSRYMIGSTYTPLRRQNKHAVDLRPNAQRNPVISIAVSGSLAILKTRNGYASGIAYDLDMLSSDIILGTIPGADTVFVALREGTPPDELRELFASVLPPAVMAEADYFFR